jgi:ligand-binding SRPBCC domain-containing protein
LPKKNVASHVEFEQWVPISIDKIFLFFASPLNLPRIMPPSMGTKLVDLKLIPPSNGNCSREVLGQLAGVGSEITTSFRILPFLPLRAQWIAYIQEFEWNHHFADVQVKGPFKSFHHRHEFVTELRKGVSGTNVRDVIDYDPGYGFLGRLAGSLFIESQLRNTFLYRQQALEKIFGLK